LPPTYLIVHQLEKTTSLGGQSRRTNNEATILLTLAANPWWAPGEGRST
jgi:hypothetical protein